MYLHEAEDGEGRTAMDGRWMMGLREGGVERIEVAEELSHFSPADPHRPMVTNWLETVCSPLICF